MKPSPLQLDAPFYPLVSVKSIPAPDHQRSEPLPISLIANVAYAADGDHAAFLEIRQENKKFPYVIELQVFSLFRLDSEGCKEAYKEHFNPATVAANVARMLYSGAREMLATVSARSPYGPANIPSLIIEPSDIEIEFEDDAFEIVLERDFCLRKDMIESLKSEMEKVSSENSRQEKAKKSKKSKSKLK